MAQVLITDDAGSVIFDGSISTEHAHDLAELVKEEFMAKEWADVPEEELGLDTGEAIENIREEPGYQEAPKGFPVLQRRRLRSAIQKLSKAEKAIKIDDFETKNTKKFIRKVYPRKRTEI